MTRNRVWVHLALLLTTIVCVFLNFAFSPVGLGEGRGDIAGAAMFTLTLVLILGSHEMGHYVLARIHRVDTSLPYFIPLPLGIGTLGAVIRIRSRIPNRNALVDIGAAGPLAGLVMMLPLMMWGIAHSRIADLPASAHVDFPGQFSVVGMLLHGWPKVGLTNFGDSLLSWGLTRCFLGPIPAGKDVFFHPVFEATWFGMLVTLLNLIPIGQLDGGHVAYAVLGDRAKWIGRAMALLLLFLLLFQTAMWALWLLVTTLVIRFRHPPVEDPVQPLTRGRMFVCALSLVALILCFMPAPITQL